jgi:hypothetical protein
MSSIEVTLDAMELQEVSLVWVLRISWHLQWLLFFVTANVASTSAASLAPLDTAVHFLDLESDV